MEQKKKDLNTQSQRDLTSSILMKDKEQAESHAKVIAQRLYAKYSDTGFIIPNKVEETLPLSKKSMSVARKGPPSQGLLSPSQMDSIDQGRNSQMRAKLPKIQSRKHLDLSQTPLPTLPFPRVLGKDIISPFPGSQDHIALKRIIAQHQAQAQVLADSQTLTASTSHQLLNTYRPGQLPSMIQSQSLTQLKIGTTNMPNSTILHNQSTLSLISPADKTLAILESHQKRNNNRNNLTHHQSFQQLIPLEQSKFLNNTIENQQQLTQMQHELTQQHVGNVSAIILKNVQQQTRNQPIAIQQESPKKKNTNGDIKKFMVRQGLMPSPLEFIRLVQMDPDFQSRFCYCNRRDDYYEFEIVPFSDKNEQEYMTVSSRGIVHFIKGEANFMTIAEWEREARIYKKIQDISFFQKYRTWKTFSAWKTLMRRTMIFKTSDFLNRELFILDSELSKPLLEIRMQTFKIQKMGMVLMHTEKPKNMQEFFEAQEKCRKQMNEALTKIEKEIKNTLIESCDNSMRTFREENRISLNDNQEDDDNEEAEPFLVGDETHKQMPYTQEATTRTHYKKLAKYIRLTDYMIIDSKLRLISNSISNVLKIVKLDLSAGRKYMIGDKVQHAPLFEINVDFKDYEIFFTPNKYDVRDAIKNSITEGVNTVCRYELFIHQPEFETYINVQESDEHLFDEQNDLMSLAIGSDMLIRDTEQISRSIDEVYDEMKEFSKKYDQFVQIYNENIKMKPDDFREQDHDFVNKFINKLMSQSEEIEQMDVRACIKIVKLEGEKMKKRIRESPKSCWNMLKEFIPQFQYEKLNDLCETLKGEYEKVSKKPTTVEEFVGYQDHLKQLSDKFDTYSSSFQEISDYNILIEEHKIKMPEKNKNKYKETQSLIINTRRKMEEGLEAGEVEELRFKKELIDIEIPKLNKLSQAIINQLKDKMFADPETQIMEAVEKLEKVGKEVTDMKVKAQKLNQYQKYLELEETPFESVSDTFYDWDLKYKLWRGLQQWIDLSKEWINTKFNQIQVEEIQKQVDAYDKMAQVCYINMKENPVTQIFKDKVDVLKSTMPVVTYLRDDALQERHWTEIYETLGMTLDLNNDEFTLNSLIELNVKQEKEKLGEIALKANKERELESMFDKIVLDWKKANYETKLYKDGYYILGSLEDINTLLEESMVTLSNILGARFVDIIRDKVEEQFKKLQILENLLNEWGTFQRTWMYLENILTGEIAQKLGQDAKRFQQVDSQWKDLMKITHNNPSVGKSLGTYKEQSYLSIFQNNNKILDDIQKSLDQLLDKKRTDFSRFYFLSNDELISILAEASRDPQCVQPHLRKLFENINRVKFENEEDITFMYSAEKEEIKIKRLKTGGQPVEKWLLTLQDTMINSVKKFIKEAHYAYKEDEDFKRHNWVMEDHPAQSICVVGSIMWCAATENLLRAEEDLSDSLEWWFNENVSQLTELTKIVSRPDIDSRKRKAVVALITQDVHYRDIVEELIKEDVDSPHDFKWQQQLRYYYNQEEITIKQVNASLDYGYEYLGATTRLVITPLTDRCWMTITGALHIKLGAAPAGPAGTGKTESTKDLAKALGKYCVVFNCSDQINFKMMEQLFSGLASTGSWACLDEFNRIDIEVLSVIAQQLLTIRNAMLENKTDFILGDKQIVKFYPTMGVFITMNPGYKGRTELPDNLKVLFRPVSMMIPDYALIAEIMLFAEGFTQAKPLSRKMTKLYKLASEQLSQQAHYDFGMRAVKSVLVMAGIVKRNNRDKLREDEVLIRAMRDSNIPKFIKEDLPLFNAIVRDLFPGVEIKEPEYEMLINGISHTQTQDGYTPDEAQTQKIIQFYETMNVRFGLMIIGNTLSGKSTVVTYLKKALNKIREDGYQGEDYLGVESKFLNPKSISMNELYGFFNHLTGEWTDGLASTIIREFVNETHNNMKWVIFDGPVDAIWIENMNTVLDDNMTLCLSNGERIKLRPEMRMIFEVDDLSQASPATVSRCGMVYASPQALNWRPIVNSWIKKLDENLINATLKNQLHNLFDAHIDNTIELVRGKGFKEPIPTVDNNFVISQCRLFQSILEHTVDLKKYEPDRQKKALIKMFIYSLAWSFGGSIDSQHYSSFEVYLGTVFNVSDLPKTSIFDNQFNLHSEILDYQSWTTNLPKFEYSKDKSFFELVVPTKDTVRFSWLLKQQIINGTPVFFTGITGVGKSIITSSTLAELKKHSNYETIMLSFSSQTSSKETQNQIEDKLEKRRRGLLAGPNGRKVILFIDDVNMPAYDNYGTQMPIELLRQYVDYKGLYDREGLFWKEIKDTTLICAAAPPEGGRKVLSKRFTRHFHMICLPPTQEESLQMIFSSIIDGFFRDFKKDVQMLAKPIVDSTLLIYTKITKELRPTPSKSHYTFNLRDISKVFQGLCMAKTQTLNINFKMMKLWIHESCRVFHDRLVCAEDKRWFTNLMVDLVQSAFRVDWKHEDLFESKPLIFGDFMKRGIPFEERQYDEVRDVPTMSKVIMEYQEEYNIDHVNKFDLVLFPECLQHISRICRILRQPRGNALLVGVGGSGKQTLTRLASFIADCQFATLEIKKASQNDFRENLKKSMLPCGIKNERTVFLINDNQITNESFLEDVNNLLNSGEIPNLWAFEDKELINNELRQVAADKGIYENIYGFYLQRMRDSFHIVLCLSPVGESFRMRVRMFPSLVNCCAINWVNSWPEEALLSVSHRFIEKIDQIREEKLKMKIAQMCVFVHQSVDEESTAFYDSLKRRVYITPKSYLDLIKSYQTFLQLKNQQLSIRRNTLFTGLSKLEETNQEVARLSEELIVLQPNLEKSVIDAEKMSKQLEKDKIEANKKKMVVEEETKIVDKQAAEVQLERDKAMGELNQVMPILEEAESALNTLNQADITEIKQSKQPPQQVQNTMKLTYMLLERKHDLKKIDWPACLKMMSQNGFFASLKTYDRDNVPQKVEKAMDEFIKQNTDFTPENVRNSSKACYSLCKWCLAILNYAKVAKKVAPKKARVDEMDRQLNKAKEELAVNQAKLYEEVKKVEDLERAYIELKEKKEKLENEIELCRQRLQRADKLTNGLGSEYERWKENVAILDGRIRQLVGDVFVAAACISYYGPFTGVFREKLVSKWVEQCKELEIPVSEKFDLAEVMGDPMEIQNWNMNSLPSDQVSISNGIIVKYGTRRPLMIDPQQQATRWIKTMYQEENIQGMKDVGKLFITRNESKEMNKLMEQCIKNGYQLLIEDMGESIQPAFEPVLLNQVFKSAQGREQINFGDAVIDFDNRFKLYMTTKMPNPHFLPEMFIRVTVINFTVTQEGLEQQLLAEIVKLENPAIEYKKLDLTKAIVNDQKRMKKIEDDILYQLVNAGENILDEEDLIQYLETSKITSKEINIAMEENEVAQVEIEEARSKYQIVAERGSILYFVIADLAGIDPMYQYSLAYFLKLFIKIIQQSEKSDDQQVRIAILIREITQIVYNNICRGLFNTHKLIFSFMIATKILIQSGDISLAEWNLYLKGVMIDGDIKNIKNPDPALITEKQWRFILNLECTSTIFNGLPDNITKDYTHWKEWIILKDPHNHPLPGNWEDKLSRFQRMLIFKAFREDKLVFKMREFVEKQLGHSFAHPLPVSMDEVFADSDNKTPIIFVLSPGAEPTALFLRFAKKMRAELPGGQDPYHIISLGQGQDKMAQHCIHAGIKAGTWVLLQNCHLYKSFMPQLEKEVIDIGEKNSNDIHPDFRLFLTSMPCDYFPVPVLQNGIKITNEPPKGIKSNMMGSFQQLNEEKIQGCKRDTEYRILIYSLCFFHAVIQERRKFGPLGWNIRYDFNESDLETAITVMKGMLSDDSDTIIWQAILNVTGDIVYGGRVTDDIDRRALMMILSTFIQEDVLTPGYKYSPSGVYVPAIAEESSLEGLLAKAKSLPDVDNPEIFGMNDNADIAFQLQESNQMIDIVLSVQPRTGGGAAGGKNPDQIIEELAIKIESQLPEPLTREGAAKELFHTNKDGLLPSLSTFLLQEMERFNKLVSVIQSSLDTLKKAIKGLAVMSDDVDKMYKSMLNNKVPELWAFYAYPSLKPLSSWIENLQERIEFLRMWLQIGKPKAYWLPAFFFPQGFLTALLQNYSRKYSIAIDQLNFGFELQTFYKMEEVDRSPGDGVFFYGFFLESGQINSDTLLLDDALPGQKYSVVPMILFRPEKDHKVKEKDYMCPIFKTSERAGTLSTTGHSTNFVIMLEVPSKKLPKHWVLRGTAMLCQLDD